MSESGRRTGKKRRSRTHPACDQVSKVQQREVGLYLNARMVLYLKDQLETNGFDCRALPTFRAGSLLVRREGADTEWLQLVIRVSQNPPGGDKVTTFGGLFGYGINPKAPEKAGDPMLIVCMAPRTANSWWYWVLRGDNPAQVSGNVVRVNKQNAIPQQGMAADIPAMPLKAESEDDGPALVSVLRDDLLLNRVVLYKEMTQEWQPIPAEECGHGRAPVKSSSGVTIAHVASTLSEEDREGAAGRQEGTGKTIDARGPTPTSRF